MRRYPKVSSSTSVGRLFRTLTPPAAAAAAAAILTLSSVAAFANGKNARLVHNVADDSSAPTGSYYSTATTTRFMSSTNPFSSMMNDVTSSLFGGRGGGSSLDTNDRVDEAIAESSSTRPSWTDLRTTLSQLETPEERAFRDNVAKGIGMASPLNKIRLFDDATEKDIQVTFYRDSASWCPYCQKVWLALESKRIPYRVEKINMSCYGTKPSSFLRIQPGGQIPVAEIKGRVYGQSNDILMALESEFPESATKLMPDDIDDPKRMARAQELFSLERQLFSAWMGWLTGRGGGKEPFVRTLQYVDEVLQKADGPFFLGSEISLVDVQFAPFLERMAASLLYFKGFVMRDGPNEDRKRANTVYPGINAWFNAMEQLPAYQLTKSDYYTHAHDLPPQLGGCTSEAASQPYQDVIDGRSSSSWTLPLSHELDELEPGWAWAGDEPAARREAVERVSYNHEAIVKFACRGAGRRGMPPVSAPLSDPNAVPNEAVELAVDTCLRTVCSALLQYDGIEARVANEDDEKAMEDLARTIVTEGGPDFAQGVVESLGYLRDRVGVPRDMRLPAARQLRAHLNWAIGSISDVKQ